ncbi:MAG: endolytic transglycosylase MltG [Woeseiaceae bacterium]
MKPGFAVAIVIVLVVALSAGIVVGQLNGFLDGPVNLDSEQVSFEIEQGSSFGNVAAKLEQQGIIASASKLRFYARWSEQAGRVQAGEYLIENGTTPRQILEQFTSGAVKLYSFTIIEGWNQWDLLRAMHSHPQIDATLTEEDWPALLAELGSAASHPEGLFLPETYHFPNGTTDRKLLAQAYSLSQQTLTDEWADRSEESIVDTPYEALILASIIEKETARVDERKRIAGVFTRRIQKRMRLQTDPTVIYGIGRDFNGNLTRKDLRTPTPYNTYTRHGLPPTPIAMPGQAAINAALHPEDGEELYFVATGLSDGSHKFSVTKDEHDAAVAEYLKRLRSRRNGAR